MKTKICVECGIEKELSIEYFEIWYRSSAGSDPRYANSCKVCRGKSAKIIKEYKMSKNLNIPIARSLNEADSFIVDNFLIIENELNSIKEYELGKNNG